MNKNNNEKDYLIKLGSKVRKLREEKGYSQERLSFICGLHRTYIGAVERGEKNITVLNLKKISDALEISITELMNLDSKEN